MASTPQTIFHLYAIEEIISALPLERLKELVKANPMLGFNESFNSWLKSTNHSHGRGALDVFRILVENFSDEKTFLIYLLEIAMEFSEENYYKKQPLAGIIENEIAALKNSERFQQKSDSYKLDKLLSRYHIEYHFFLQVISGTLRKCLQDIEVYKKLLAAYEKYLLEFHQTSKRFELNNQGLHQPNNGVVWFAIDYFQDEFSLVSQLIETNNNYPLAWRFISPEEAVTE